jgi:molecular chaperone GrpE
MEEDKRGPDQVAEERAGMLNGDNAADAQNAGAADMIDPVAKLSAELEAQRAESSELRDKNLRIIAEMENLRRRTERDKAEFAKYAISEFARDIVGVGDNIRRAIEAVPKEAVLTDPALRSMVEGIEVTERDLLKVLEKYQVKRFDPLGEPFNPHLHEAMTKIDVPNVPADTVVQVIHAGYMIDERVLRPAAVIVAKGGQGVDTSSKPFEKPKSDEPLPPGAMKVPDDVVTSSVEPEPAPQPGRPQRPDVQQNVLGRDYQAERRRHTGQHHPGEERVTQFRRARGGQGGDQPNDGRSQNANGGPKSSNLHKPVIGSGNE